MAIDKMQCNGDKTVHVELLPGESRRTAFEILGNNIDPDQEIRKRRENATKAFAGLIRIWSRRSDIDVGLKMLLYNAIVKPHLTYNAAASAYTGQQVAALDRMHRKQLRRLLNVFYPAHISNAEVYEQTCSHPIAEDITRLRWMFTGHILRQPPETPANRVMRYYYNRSEQEGGPERLATSRSKCLTTVPRLLQKDLRLLSKHDRSNFFAGVRWLSKREELVSLRRLAQNRPHWSKAVAKIVEAVHSMWKSKELERLAKKRQNEAAAMAMARQEPQAVAERPIVRRQTTLMDHFTRINSP
jgi:hypothetical protein